MRELKVIFLGEPKAGKTSLLRRLEDNSFNEHEPQTDGIFIKALEFEQLPTFSAQKKLHGLVGYFWDFGGQEIMNATHQFFLTERSVYVLLLNAREDKNVGQQIRQWLKRIQATGGTSSVIVAVNQIDLNNGFGFENERELKREFPQIEAFIKISCKDKKHQGIEQLKNLLEQHICKTLARFKTEIDERWLPLKTELQRVTKAKRYLNQKSFERICRKHQLFVGLEQQSLIRFLHDLGFVLHFSHIDLGYYSKKVNLDDYYVLDPSWITAGVYQILTSQYAAIENGEVCMSKLAYIVNKEAEKKAAYHISDSQRLTYNSVERDFLVNILYKFKLCFYHSGGHKFIIPDLLTTKEPPPYDEIRNSRDSLQFIYHYPYLPKSVMPHIIVDMHEHLEEKWRTGCIFAYQNCRALLYSYNDEIRIIVVSDTATNHVPKRSVMDMMRFVLGNINAKLAKQPEKQIPLFDENNVEVGRAKYKALLALQKKGRKFYDFYNDFSSEMMEFEISRLLEGISSVKEINHDYRGLEDMRSILRNQKKMANNQALLLRQQIITSSNLYDLEKKL